MFFPPLLSGAWTKWIAGDWLGSAKSDSGKGRAIVDIEQALRGQFLIIHLQAKIAELEAEHLKKHMKATEAAELRQQTKPAIVDKRAEPPRE